jgi:hypothetical protein
LTRLQRASKGSSQSTRRGSDNVIQGCGVRLQNRRGHLVMLRYGAVHSEYDRLLFGRKIGPAHGALHALNAYLRPVNHLIHNDRMVSRNGTPDRPLPTHFREVPGVGGV